MTGGFNLQKCLRRVRLIRYGEEFLRGVNATQQSSQPATARLRRLRRKGNQIFHFQFLLMLFLPLPGA